MERKREERRTERGEERGRAEERGEREREREREREGERERESMLTRPKPAWKPDRAETWLSAREYRRRRSSMHCAQTVKRPNVAVRNEAQ